MKLLLFIVLWFLLIGFVGRFLSFSAEQD